MTPLLALGLLFCPYIEPHTLPDGAQPVLPEREELIIEDVWKNSNPGI